MKKQTQISVVEIQMLDENQIDKRFMLRYIDPALLTMVLQFQAAQCTTIKRLEEKKVSLKEQNNSEVGKKMNLRENFKYDAKISLFCAPQPKE